MKLARQKEQCMQRYIEETAITLFVENVGNIRENGEVDEGLDHEDSHKLGKVFCFESSDRFEVGMSGFYLSFRKQPE